MEANRDFDPQCYDVAFAKGVQAAQVGAKRESPYVLQYSFEAGAWRDGYDEALEAADANAGGFADVRPVANGDDK